MLLKGIYEGFFQGIYEGSIRVRFMDLGDLQGLFEGIYKGSINANAPQRANYPNYGMLGSGLVSRATRGLLF